MKKIIRSLTTLGMMVMPLTLTVACSKSANKPQVNQAQKDVDLVLKQFQEAHLNFETHQELQASQGVFNQKVLQNWGIDTSTYPKITLPQGVLMNYVAPNIKTGSSGQINVTIAKKGAQSKSFEIVINVIKQNLVNVNTEALVKANISFDGAGTLTIGSNVGEINYDVSTIKGWNPITDIIFEKPKNISVIGDHAFTNARFTNLDFTPLTNLQYIGKNAFTISPLQSLKLNGLTKLTSIGVSAFANAWNLKALDLSHLTSLTTIGVDAFNTSGLNEINLLGDNQLHVIGKSAFGRTLQGAKVKMPASQWKN